VIQIAKIREIWDPQRHSLTQDVLAQAHVEELDPILALTTPFTSHAFDFVRV
jgi:hypothetical protein